MNDYDLMQIFKLLQNSDTDLENRISDLKYKHSIFKDFDTLDLLDLIELKSNLAYHRAFEQKLLQLINFLYEFNKE